MSLTQNLVELIGADAAAKLCTAFGGMKFYMGPDARARFALVIGDELAARVVERYRTDVVELPRETAAQKQARTVGQRERIRKFQEAGMNKEEVAVAMELTLRRVRDILNG